MEIQVKVTRTEIRSGEPQQPCACPIALALQPIVKMDVDVAVGSEDVQFYSNDNSRAIVDLPAEARQFVEKFDLEYPVDEISFPLDIPDEYLKRAA